MQLARLHRQVLALPHDQTCLTSTLTQRPCAVRPRVQAWALQYAGCNGTPRRLLRSLFCLFWVHLYLLGLPSTLQTAIPLDSILRIASPTAAMLLEVKCHPLDKGPLPRFHVFGLLTPMLPARSPSCLPVKQLLMARQPSYSTVQIPSPRPAQTSPGRYLLHQI
ncbi:hypothetical protein DFH07DRAFT_814331 [Mycena maculata]|uniref:Uncharacterized protein n=1 Tax=Mycena maculata TaxID=230809 RepID=A0AAD7JDJ1_9AGAR|nr:hypothetical protein DFH07DRAFT_814331 [Mycena maculata]